MRLTTFLLTVLLFAAGCQGCGSDGSEGFNSDDQQNDGDTQAVRTYTPAPPVNSDINTERAGVLAFSEMDGPDISSEYLIDVAGLRSVMENNHSVRVLNGVQGGQRCAVLWPVNDQYADNENPAIVGLLRVSNLCPDACDLSLFNGEDAAVGNPQPADLTVAPQTALEYVRAAGGGDNVRGFSLHRDLILGISANAAYIRVYHSTDGNNRKLVVLEAEASGRSLPGSVRTQDASSLCPDACDMTRY